MFYLARPPRRKFVADAVLGSNVKVDGKEFSVKLSKIHLWKKQIPIKPLIDTLEFIKNKGNWGDTCKEEL